MVHTHVWEKYSINLMKNCSHLLTLGNSILNSNLKLKVEIYICNIFVVGIILEEMK